MADRSYRKARYPWVVLAALAMVIVSACGGGGSGRVQTPVVTVLPVGTPLEDVVTDGGFKGYASAVSPGTFYKVSITAPSDDADLLVFGGDGTFTVFAQCSIDTTGVSGVSPEDCVIRAPGSTLYFAVDGSFLIGSAGTYTIAVEPLTTTALALSTPLADSVGRREAKIYAVPAPAVDSYTVSITGLSDDADLFVFGTDAFLSSPAACLVDNTQRTGTQPEDCTLLSGGGTLSFVVDGIFSAAAAAGYTALAAPAVP
ncbi:MAG: hypothetical protein ACYC7L_02930 [Nitrospirota bacterium]